MIKYFLSFSFLISLSCNQSSSQQNTKIVASQEEQPHLILEKESTVKSRFLPPKGYKWVNTDLESFGYFLENFNLKPYKTPILKYDGTAIVAQNLHEAVFNIDVGDKDLQQCADAIIRLKAEYHYQRKEEDKIKFYFTSGDRLSWIDYKSGIRAVVNGNNVDFQKLATADSSKENFRKYLDLIFTYAGTISLTNYETKAITDNKDLATGDILITAGSPGHIVFIAGVAKNVKGDKLYLLGQGFTPAQSIHILSNPFNKQQSPWYNLDVDAKETKTARYLFKPNNFRKFNNL